MQDPHLALDLDVALALRLHLSAKADVRRPAGRPDPGVLAAGDRYVVPEDYGRPLDDPARAAASRVAFLAMLEREREH